MAYDFLIVGLGNPGSEYSATRHNVGFMVVEKLIEKHKGEIKKGKFSFYGSELKIKGKKILAVMPTTFMNRSGEAVKKIKDAFNIENEKILVIYDEYNFPTGKIHIRLGGSDGGHNGAFSIIEELGSDKFYRLRFGIDKKFGSGELVDYVLSNFFDDEKDALKIGIENSIKAIEFILTENPSKALSFINSGKLFANKEKENIKKDTDEIKK